MATRSSSSSRRGTGVVASSGEHGPLPLAVRRLLWAVGLAAWCALLAAMLSFDPADAPGHGVAPIRSGGAVLNWMGPAGAWVAYQTVTMIGSGVWILMISAGAYLAAIAFRGTVTHVAVRALGVLMVALAYSGFHALFMPWFSGLPEGGGGLVAIVGVHELASRFGNLGAALWLTLMAVVGLTVAFDDWFASAARAIGQPFAIIAKGAASAGTAIAKMIGGQRTGAAARAKKAAAAVAASEGAKRKKSAPVIEEEEAGPSVAVVDDDAQDENDEGGEPETEPQDDGDDDAVVEASDEDEESAEEDDDAQASADDAADDETDIDDEASSEEASDEEDEASYDPQELRAKIAKLPVRFSGAERRSATEAELDELRGVGASSDDAARQYVFPSIDLLVEPEAGYEQALESYVREQAQALETALHTYNIKGEVAGIESGPVITLYQVRLAPGTKVSAITAVASDIARSLKSVNIRVVPNTEGLDTVGVEVPNRKKEKVRLKELMTRSETLSKMKLPMFLGKDASGRPLVVDLASLPHLLIAGTTGSGKSVCMNAIIMGFLYTQKPSDLKLVLVDPKVVELSQFKDIPHLMCPVVTDMSKAAAILEWAVGKMDERYELLAEAGCRDISSYNALSWDELKERMNPQSEAEEARIPRRLPYMVFIIDELADLMMTNKEVEGAIVRIAQKARAVGIHLILATQRPQANVVTGLIKSNMPGRMCFKVASGMDSRIVLDQKGGELLLGQGDMLFITPRSSTPMRCQGTLVDDSEIRNCVRFVREVSSPSFERQLVQLRSGGGAGPEPGSEEHEARMLENAQEDPLFDRAVEIVLETKRGSVSLLQRRLAIGYTRASRLIELMGMAGIIGDHKGSVAREVTMSLEEWQAIKKQAELDAAANESKGGKAAPSGQPKLFPEPVTAKEVLSGRARDEHELPASVRAVTGADLAGAVLANTDEVEEPPFDVAEAAEPVTKVKTEPKPAPAAIVEEDIEEEEIVDEIEEEDAEEEEIVDEVEEEEAEEEEIVDEVEEEDAEEGDDAEASAEDDEEYEYEYVEVEDEAELEGEEYEVVDEAEAKSVPEVIVKKPGEKTQADRS
jgi:DNA segregation ATPase FtsK/SpoIIIE, S-DNA-T family